MLNFFGEVLDFADALDSLLEELRAQKLQRYGELVLLHEAIQLLLLVVLLEEGGLLRDDLLDGVNLGVLDLLIAEPLHALTQVLQVELGDSVMINVTMTYLA